MTEYITKDQALEIVKRTSGDYATAFSEIRSIPPADVVEVVRCKDCGRGKDSGAGRIWCRLHHTSMHGNGYCSDGEEE